MQDGRGLTKRDLMMQPLYLYTDLWVIVELLMVYDDSSEGLYYNSSSEHTSLPYNLASTLVPSHSTCLDLAGVGCSLHPSLHALDTLHHQQKKKGGGGGGGGGYMAVC